MSGLANLIGSKRGYILCCGICIAGVTAMLLCLAFV